MARRQKVPEPPMQDQVRDRVNELLTATTITPWMIYQLLLTGHRMYRYHDISESQAWEAIIGAFSDQGRQYLTPDQMSALRGKWAASEDLDQLNK